MAATEREQLRVPELPLSDTEISTFLVLWAVNGKKGHFRIAEAVTLVPLLREHLRLSAVEQQELHLRMGKSCCPVYPAMYTNEYV
jgi:ribosomal protein S4E